MHGPQPGGWAVTVSYVTWVFSFFLFILQEGPRVLVVGLYPSGLLLAIPSTLLGVQLPQGICHGIP